MSLSTGVKTAADFDTSPLAVSARYQFAQQMSSEAVKLSAVRLLPLTNEAARLSVVHERGVGIQARVRS